jgi:hypothetical protein
MMIGTLIMNDELICWLLILWHPFFGTCAHVNLLLVVEMCGSTHCNMDWFFLVHINPNYIYFNDTKL